jgi:16S rRNA (cytosine967-C5)-methyltransferase
MRNGGRIGAAIEVLEDVLGRHQPVKTALRDWGKRARYAGAKDRAWVSGLVLDALRRKSSLAHDMGTDTARALILACLVRIWGWGMKDLESALTEEHAPAKLSGDERERLVMAPDPAAPAYVRGDFPDWMTPYFERAFGERMIEEAMAMNGRAPVDLRVNSLKATPEKAGRALESVRAIPSPLTVLGYRVPAAEPTERGGSVETIPAYSKGWVEVQDTGSQIAALASGAKPGIQVLDYCAGGGGKALALSAMMENTGQIHAYDIDGRRLSAIFPRLKRAGARNVQVRHPQEGPPLDDLIGAMDIVFIDAPCTGTGTWRRKPDAKWRVSEGALAKRNEEQAAVLENGAHFVKPGGRMIYVTCSFLKEEDEDQVDAFLASHPDFKREDAAAAVIGSGGLTEEGVRVISTCRTQAGDVRMTPLRADTDGFYFSVLSKVK